MKEYFKNLLVIFMAMMLITVISSCEKDNEEDTPKETLKGTAWHSPESGNTSAETLKFTTDTEGIKLSENLQEDFTYTLEDNRGHIDFENGTQLIEFTISGDKLAYSANSISREFNKCDGECPEIGGNDSDLETIINTYWYNPTASDGLPVKLYFVNTDYSFYLGSAVGIGFDFTYVNPNGTLNNLGPNIIDDNYTFKISENGRELTLTGDDEVLYKIIETEHALSSNLESLVSTAWIYTFENYKEHYMSYTFTSASEGELKDNGQTLAFTYTYSNPHVSLTYNGETQHFTVLDGVMALDNTSNILTKIDINESDHIFKDGEFSITVNEVVYEGNYVINTDDKFSIRQFVAANNSFQWLIQQDDDDFQIGSTFDMGTSSYCGIDFNGDGEITNLEIVSGTVTVNSENKISINSIYKDNDDNQFTITGSMESHIN
ncbi:MAG: hypothetical protein KAH25_06970 [Bacteroidales bacterium]|nr:hypothetical protein [Bacteroidales bacterium]